MKIIEEEEIEHIFVGREKKLQKMQRLLNNISLSSSNNVYLILNTPGIGKTKFVEHFGTYLMDGHPFREKESNQRKICENALYIKHKITEKQSISEIYEKIVKNAYTQAKNMFTEFPEMFPKTWRGFQKYNQTPGTLLSIMSGEITIILHLDEFQESIHGEDKSIYYELGTFLSGIIEVDPIFPIISGTKFTIINTIGENSISPLNGKVKKIVLTHLDHEEQELFINKIISDPQNEEEKKLIEEFRSWILNNSGGHPRIMVNMSLEFHKLLKESPLGTHSIPKFFSELEKNTYKTLKGLFWRSKYGNIIGKMADIIPNWLQSQLIKYILHEMDGDFKLPKLETQLIDFAIDYIKTVRPNDIQVSEDAINLLIQSTESTNSTKKQISAFISILVQSGYLLINGFGNFYMLNKYAFESFLVDWDEYLPNWHKIYLEFIQNPSVKEIMQHSAQSFGWTLEIIVKYGILALIRETNQIFPNNYAELINMNDLDAFNVPTDYVKHDGNISQKLLQTFPENIYVILPTAKGIDGLIKNGNRVLMLQITSNKDPSDVKDKFNKFNLYIKNLQDECISQFEIVPWFLSLKTSSFWEDTEDFSGLVTKDTLWNQILANKI